MRGFFETYAMVHPAAQTIPTATTTEVEPDKPEPIKKEIEAEPIIIEDTASDAESEIIKEEIDNGISSTDL